MLHLLTATSELFCRQTAEQCMPNIPAPSEPTSRNLFSCLSCPFSARSCVTTLIASAMMLVLSLFTALLGSSALLSSVKLQKQTGVWPARIMMAAQTYEGISKLACTCLLADPGCAWLIRKPACEK